MLNNKYKLSPTRKVQYVQKGMLGGGNFWKKMTAGQWPITILALIVLFFVGLPTIKNYLKQEALDREIADVKMEIAEYEDKNSDLKNMLRYLESDQAVEERGRLNLGLKKEGEKVIVISRVDKTESNPVSANNSLDQLSNPQKWWRYFFN